MPLESHFPETRAETKFDHLLSHKIGFVQSFVIILKKANTKLGGGHLSVEGMKDV